MKYPHISSLILLFTCSLLIGPSSAQAAISKIQERPPLTLKQIEDLISVPTPDKAISLEIEKLSIDFVVDDELIQQLRALGAGPLTLSALAKQNSKTRLLKTTILVADFRGVNNENVGLYEILLQRLRDSVAAFPDIQIQPLGKPITAEQGREAAIREGKLHNASIVLWGWFVKSPVQGHITAYVEFLRQSHVINLSSSREQYTVGIDQFNEFKLQSKLSDDLSYISLAATAMARLDLGDFEGAISRLTSAIEMPVESTQLIDASDVYVLRGLSYLYQANAIGSDTLPQALADSEQAIKLNNRNTSAYLLRAYALLLKGNGDQALTEGEKLLDMSNQPTQRISIYALLLQALDQQQNNFNDEKRRQAENYTKEILTLTRDPQFATADTWYQRAAVLDRLGNEQEAIAILKTALTLKPDDGLKANIHFYLGSMLQRRGEYKEALAEFDDVVKLNPRRKLAYMNRAHIHFWMKNYSNAIAEYNKVISLDSRDSMQYSNRGRAYQDSGDLANALNDYDRAIKLDSKNSTAFYNRASLYGVQKQTDLALKDLNNCLELSPDDREALYLRADLSFEKGAYDVSIEDLTQVIKIDRNDAYAFLLRGKAEIKKGRSEKGLEDFTQSIVLAPYYATAYLERGLTYADQGRRNEAIADLNHAVEYADDEETRQKAKQELSKVRSKSP